mgnify:CR=1 FL=1
MKITKKQLKQIVAEEVAHRLLDQIIEEEFEAYLTENEDLEAYKKAKKRDLVSKVKKGLLSTAAVGALFGLLNQKTTDYADIKAAEREMVYQANVEKDNTDEAQLQQFADQLNNTARYMWGVGNSGAMPVPGTDGKITVLPPSYSLAVRAFLDKKENIKRSHLKKSLNTGIRVPELDVVSGTGAEKMIVMLNPNKIDANYILPELGMTAADYYNSQYGTFLGSGEKEALDTGAPEPELKEGKITWKNYKNRKKKLA